MDTNLIENSIHMIPPGLVSCLINGREYRVTEITPEAFAIRSSEILDEIQSLQINFYRFNESRYEELFLKEYTLPGHVSQEFCQVYSFTVNQKDYREEISKVILFYTKYIKLKMSGDDSYCSEEMTGYPASEDDVFADTMTGQRKKWFSGTGQSYGIIRNDYELAVGIDNYNKYAGFLRLQFDEFYRKLLKENYLEEHPLLKKVPDRVYIGNQFCHNLFPEHDMLIELLNKALGQELKITVVFSYIRDTLIENTEETVNIIYNWCITNETTIEIVINDWALPAILVGKEDRLVPILGVLINKRRKDPRYSYKIGYEKYKELLAQNNLGLAEYQKFLKDRFKINRYEYESSGLLADMPVEHKSLHFPYYQTNTSQFCTLYAGYVNKNRSRQELVTNCPRYCERMFYSYPEHLKMLGRYNSLFGMDDTMLNDDKELAGAIAGGTDRLVLDTL